MTIPTAKTKSLELPNFIVASIIGLTGLIFTFGSFIFMQYYKTSKNLNKEHNELVIYKGTLALELQRLNHAVSTMNQLNAQKELNWKEEHEEFEGRIEMNESAIKGMQQCIEDNKDAIRELRIKLNLD